MLKENHILINKTARYFTLGNPNHELKQIWFILHGYGQLAKEFLEEFKPYLQKDKLFIAPEALNKFYFRGFSGKIGASWMTKEDRENEISDYTNFLSSIYNKFLKDISVNHLEVNILAFSQGCHTAIRWLNNTKLPVSKVVLWGGTFPDDVKMSGSYWKEVNIINVQGKSDKLINRDKLNEQIKGLIDDDIKIKTIEHEGKHELYKSTLEQIIID